jgi:hypothetical protein
VVSIPDAGGRGVERIVFFGGEGPGCFFQTFFEVLFVKVEGLVVPFFLFEVLHVKCNPTE